MRSLHLQRLLEFTGRFLLLSNMILVFLVKTLNKLIITPRVP